MILFPNKGANNAAGSKPEVSAFLSSFIPNSKYLLNPAYAFILLSLSAVCVRLRKFSGLKSTPYSSLKAFANSSGFFVLVFNSSNFLISSIVASSFSKTVTKSFLPVIESMNLSNITFEP